MNEKESHDFYWNLLELAAECRTQQKEYEKEARESVKIAKEASEKDLDQLIDWWYETEGL